MNICMIALPAEWESRIRGILEGRNHSPTILSGFEGLEKIVRGSEPAIVCIYAADAASESLRRVGALRKGRSPSELMVVVCSPEPPDKERWPAFRDAGVNFVVSTAFSDYEIDFRFAASECLLKSPATVDNVAQGPEAEAEFVPDNEQVPYGEFRTTLSGRFIKVNQGIVRLLGYSSKDELMKANIVRDVYFDPEERTRFVATVPSQRIAMESVWKRRDGSTVAVHLSGRVVLDESRGTIFFHGFVWDISEQKMSRDLLLMQRDLGTALLQIGTLRELLDAVLDQVVRIEGVDCGGIYLVDAATRVHRLAASRGLSPEGAEAAAIATMDMDHIRLCEEGKPFYEKTAEIPPHYAEWFRSEGLVSVGCVPIVHNGVLVATLNMGSRTRHEFSRMARLALESIAMQIGGGIARVQAEETLRASRANLQMLFDTIGDLLLVVDYSGRILDFNAAAVARLGYAAEELRGKHVTEVHPKHLKFEVETLFQKGLDGSVTFCKLPYVAKSGEVLPMEIRSVLGTWNGQKVIIGVIRDLSEREEIRKALAESEARFRAIYENSSVGIGLTDIEGNILDVNDAIAKIAGIPREEIVGRNFREFTTPEEGERQVNSFRDILEGRSDIYESENRYFRMDGTPFWVRCTSFKVPVAEGETSRYVISLIENIDARKQAEESLRESESRYRLITDNVDDVVWSARWTPPEDLASFDPRTLLESAIQGWRFEFISPSVERLFGFTVEECLADMPQYRRVPETFPAIIEDVLNELFGHGGGAVRRTFEIPLYTKTGSQRWCEITVTILPLERDRPFRVIGILRDITARREIREALRKSEAQFRGLFRNMPDLVLLVDHTGAIRYVNHHTPTVPPETLLGGNAFNFVQAAYRERAKATFDRALATKEAQNVEAISIFGTYWLFRIVPMYVEGILDHVMAICTDVTAERKAAQELLKEQQLLRQMIDLQERERRFLSYEIHDGFAQQITGALFHIEAFQRLRKDEPEQAEKNLEQSAALLSRSIDETRRLISGLRPPILDESGILAAVEYLVCEYRGRSEADIMFRHELRGKRFAPPLESAVFRIVQEGLTNATRHSRSDFIRVELNELDDRLQIVIFDEGVGFDPKAVPENRFGLRSIRERTRLLGGKLEIESSPGEGCTIRVELPFVPGTEQNTA